MLAGDTAKPRERFARSSRCVPLVQCANYELSARTRAGGACRLVTVREYQPRAVCAWSQEAGRDRHGQVRIPEVEDVVLFDFDARGIGVASVFLLFGFWRVASALTIRPGRAFR